MKKKKEKEKKKKKTAFSHFYSRGARKKERKWNCSRSIARVKKKTSNGVVVIVFCCCGGGSGGVRERKDHDIYTPTWMVSLSIRDMYLA